MTVPPDPEDVAAYEQLLAEVTIGSPVPLTQPIELQDHDPEWASWFALEAIRLREALGVRAVRLEHVGSTAVPGLAAKPTIDIVLEVSDSANEAAYLPALEAVGYVLRAREPDWFEHRFFKGPDVAVNLHVFSAGCTETDRMIKFREWLRADAVDRERYARVKRELAARDWTYMQQYADAKTAVIQEITARAEAASGLA